MYFDELDLYDNVLDAASIGGKLACMAKVADTV